ncbi:MAG: nuclease-related domain-containing protein [Chloroflexia bacterium]
MALMHPADCPPTATPTERAVFAALASFADDTWSAWFQANLPGRHPVAPAGHAAARRPTPMRADFVLLGTRGLYIIEVKGWRAASVLDADENKVTFRNGARAQHPLMQAYRYAAALSGLLREQPGCLSTAPIPVRYAAAMPNIRAADLPNAPWCLFLSGVRILLAEEIGPKLPGRLLAIGPAGGAISRAQREAVARLLTRSGGRTPSAQWPPLFEV